MTRHFLRDDDLNPSEQREVLELALEFKRNRLYARPFEGPKAVALLFDKPTLRTQVSFTVGVAELGGHPLLVDGNLAQIGVRESVADTAKVLGRQVSAIVWRTFEQSRLEEMAANVDVPVVNALTDSFHPCQVLADLASIAYAKGGLDALPGLKLAYIGDGANNMAHSYLLGGATAGVHVTIATPPTFLPNDTIFADAEELAVRTGGSVRIVHDPAEAVSGADVVATDTWVSMGTEEERDAREKAFEGFQVTEDLMALASPDAVVIHCLPAYRGKEITTGVLDGPQSIVWEEAEFRLHAQKAILTWLVEQ
ncbi:MAG: ornithine carbamoyltransferase [Demequinaceae bacterium]|nr:ornithine carbamoyltransferase [Demequinaceae bacterium]